MGTFTSLDASSATNCIFTGCDTITAPGTDLTGTQMLTPSVAADTGAVVWNVAQNPDGELDDMTFTVGGNAHHAIEFGTSAPLTMTLRGIDFQGFNVLDANNDSTLLFPNTGSDVTWTVSLVNCSSGVTYKKARGTDTVVLSVDPRTITINARDSAGTLITDSTEITLVQTAGTTILHEEDNITDGSTAYAYTYSSDIACYVNVVSAGAYVPKTVDPVTLIDADQTLNVYLDDDRVYSNP